MEREREGRKRKKEHNLMCVCAYMYRRVIIFHMICTNNGRTLENEGERVCVCVCVCVYTSLFPLFVYECMM